MTVSPTELTRRLVRQVVGPDIRMGINDPDPAHLAPTALDDNPVYVQVYMVDGWRDRFEQQPEMDIHVYSRSFRRAEEIAMQVEDALVRYPVRVEVGGKPAVLDRTEVTTAAREVPWDVDQGVTQFIGTYQLRTRS